MFERKSQRIALISVSGDPAVEIGKEEAGGQNVYVRQVGLALAQQGWQVDMFARRTSSEQAAVVQHTENCRTIRLTAGPVTFIGRDHVFGYLPEFVQQLEAFQKREGISHSLVHTNYWLSAWVGMELKQRQAVKLVHTYHSLGAVKYRAIQNVPAIASTRLAVEKRSLETADLTVATSPQEELHMERLVSNQGNISVIPCGTDIKRFGSVDRNIARQALGLPPEAKIVLYVGRFDRRKGIETLVRAVEKSQLRHQTDLRLIIGGGSRPGESDGIERDRIEGIVQELGLQNITSFPGALGDTNLHLYYAAADVCVVPSHYEPFGLVAIEAMASKTPVIASQVGGLQFTVVPEETGLLVPAQDEPAFAAAIDRILADPTWRDQLGAKGRQRVKAYFSWESIGTQLGHAYKQLLAQPASGVPAQKPQVAA